MAVVGDSEDVVVVGGSGVGTCPDRELPRTLLGRGGDIRDPERFSEADADAGIVAVASVDDVWGGTMPASPLSDGREGRGAGGSDALEGTAVGFIADDGVAVGGDARGRGGGRDVDTLSGSVFAGVLATLPLASPAWSDFSAGTSLVATSTAAALRFSACCFFQSARDSLARGFSGSFGASGAGEGSATGSSLISGDSASCPGIGVEDPTTRAPPICSFGVSLDLDSFSSLLGDALRSSTSAESSLSCRPTALFLFLTSSCTTDIFLFLDFGRGDSLSTLSDDSVSAKAANSLRRLSTFFARFASFLRFERPEDLEPRSSASSASCGSLRAGELLRRGFFLSCTRRTSFVGVETPSSSSSLSLMPAREREGRRRSTGFSSSESSNESSSGALVRGELGRNGFFLELVEALRCFFRCSFDETCAASSASSPLRDPPSSSSSLSS